MRTYTIKILDGGKDEAWKFGFNARNSLTGIKIWRGIDNFVGVLAQEMYEIERKQLFLVVSTLILGAVSALFYHLTQSPLSFLLIGLAFGAPRMAIGRKSELFSHAIEIQAGLHFGTITDLSAKEVSEAASMVRYDWLKGMTQEEILAAMRAEYGPAFKWVRKRIDQLENLAL